MKPGVRQTQPISGGLKGRGCPLRVHKQVAVRPSPGVALQAGILAVLRAAGDRPLHGVCTTQVIGALVLTGPWTG
jgi:hypothetical protein